MYKYFAILYSTLLRSWRGIFGRSACGEGGGTFSKASQGEAAIFRKDVWRVGRGGWGYPQLNMPSLWLLSIYIYVQKGGNGQLGFQAICDPYSHITYTTPIYTYDKQYLSLLNIFQSTFV